MYAQFGPSLKSLHSIDLYNKQIILKTTNGTLAGIELLKKGVKHRLIGSLHNAKTVMKEAVNLADKTERNITIVCAGRENGRIAAIDDTYITRVLV